MTNPRKPMLYAALALIGGFALTSGKANAFDLCGNAICATTANPPETCSSCPEDCGPCPPPFGDLIDPGDSKIGRLVATNIKNTDFGSTLGQEHPGSYLTLATDPTNSARVYISWVTYSPAVIHVRRSDDRGANWTGDLIAVTDAINPSLAVNSVGTVALLYQLNTPFGVPLANQRWQTHVRRSTSFGATWTDIVLADTPASVPVVQSYPYLGSTTNIQAVGKNFYGAFSASNVPDLANFPRGVVYQRRANFTTKQLIQNDGVSVAQPSIDPFFFRLLEP